MRQIHWNGKLTVDRLGESCEVHCIVTSNFPGYAVGKLLAVQKLLHATGKAPTGETFHVLEIWDYKRCSDHVGFVIPLQATAVGRGGAAKEFEGLIGSKLFCHACCHHIYELIIKAAYKKIFGVETTGQEKNIHVQKFKAISKDIDKSQNFTTLTFSQTLITGKSSKSALGSSKYFDS